MHSILSTKQIFHVIICLLAFSVHAKSQPTGQIKGLVYDSQTMGPLPGATIIYGKDRGTATDENGFYQFVAESSNIVVRIQYIGYNPAQRELFIPAGDTIILNIGLEPHVTEIEQVVVSAGRVEQRISDLTVSLSLIRPAVISSSHITDVSELMNKVSGVEVLDGQASIRGGSGFSYGAGSRVMVLVDGLPMLSADAGGVKWQSLPMENLSQIEIIKGASSVLYGSSALNGIINFRTAPATKAGETRFFAESGIFGSPRQKDWIWWDSPRVFSNLSFSHLKKYGNTDVGIGTFMQLDNGYRKLNEDKLGRANLRVLHYNQQLEGLSYGIVISGYMNKKQDFILWENAHTGALKQNVSTAQILHGSTLALDPSISYSQKGRFNHDLRSRILLSDNTFPDGGQNNSNTRSMHSEYQLRFRASEAVAVNAGLSQYFSSIQSAFYGDHHASNSAVYAQTDINPFERLKLVAGLRLEQNTLNGEKDHIAPLFRAGINYRAFDITFLRASYGQGYRYPSIAEKHAATTLGAVSIIPNPDIGSESGWNSELGVKQGLRFGDFEGLVDLSLFYSQNSDLIEYVFGFYQNPKTEEYGFGFKATNIEHSRVYGLELEFMITSRSGPINHSITGGYVYMYPVEFNPYTRRNTNTHLKFRRKHAMNLNFTSGFQRFEFGLHFYAKSRILNIDDVFLNPLTREEILPGFYDYWISNNRGYIVMDTSIAYNINQRYKLSFIVKNMTNTEYMGRPGDIQPHRNISLRISGKLGTTSSGNLHPARHL
jgi:outer membrane cobalamin receptor